VAYGGRYLKRHAKAAERARAAASAAPAAEEYDKTMFLGRVARGQGKGGGTLGFICGVKRVTATLKKAAALFPGGGAVLVLAADTLPWDLIAHLPITSIPSLPFPLRPAYPLQCAARPSWPLQLAAERAAAAVPRSHPPSAPTRPAPPGARRRMSRTSSFRARYIHTRWYLRWRPRPRPQPREAAAWGGRGGHSPPCAPAQYFLGEAAQVKKSCVAAVLAIRPPPLDAAAHSARAVHRRVRLQAHFDRLRAGLVAYTDAAALADTPARGGPSAAALWEAWSRGGLKGLAPSAQR
jgi:hypothetical protein